MKRYALLGGVALALTACGGPTPESILIDQLGDAGYRVTESNYDEIISTADEVCAMDQDEFNQWRSAGDLVETIMYGSPNNKDDMAWRFYCINKNGLDNAPVWNFNG